MNTRHAREQELANAVLTEVRLRNIPFDEVVIALSAALILYIEVMVPTDDMRKALMDQVLDAMRRAVDVIECRRAHGGDLWRPKP